MEGKDELEIGYLLKRKYWHMGYATEAALACKEYAFNDLGRNRVTSIIRDNNFASQHVAERVGMKIEKRFISIIAIWIYRISCMLLKKRTTFKDGQ